MNGSEQSLYEYYLFKSIYEDKINLELINIFGDMHEIDYFMILM